jgi:hypothetical protein
VKISPHPHGPHSGGDTERYLHAGAASAAIVTAVEEISSAENTIIESNAVLEAISPDLFVFVTDPEAPEWKESARRVVARADIVVAGRITDEVLRRVRECLSRGRHLSNQELTP